MKFTWLAAAAALAGWLIARRHKQKRWFQIGELVVIAVAVLIGLGVIQLPNFEKVLENVGQALVTELLCDLVHALLWQVEHGVGEVGWQKVGVARDELGRRLRLAGDGVLGDLRPRGEHGGALAEG